LQSILLLGGRVLGGDVGSKEVVGRVGTSREGGVVGGMVVQVELAAEWEVESIAE
jgi:hypothetical protein